MLLRQTIIRFVNQVTRRAFTSPNFCTAAASIPAENDNFEQVVQNLCNNDEELEKKLRVIQLEVEVLRQEGSQVPSKLRQIEWKELLECQSRGQRIKLARFFFLNEKKRENFREKQLAKKQLWEEKKALLAEQSVEDDPNCMQYGLGKNSIMIRVSDQAMNFVNNAKLITAHMYGQHLVFDCSYDSEMNKPELSTCANQLQMAFSENRARRDPYDLYLCNAPQDGETIKRLIKFIPPLFEPWFPLNVTEKSYLDIFPREKLVYLTPHCEHELKTFDHDAIYIIGAMVDKSTSLPHSLARAKRDGLKMAKLPLDRYLDWGDGSGKSLTLNNMVQIMSEFKATQSWDHALKFVPSRKLREFRVASQERRLAKQFGELTADRSFIPRANLRPLRSPASVNANSYRGQNFSRYGNSKNNAPKSRENQPSFRVSSIFDE